MSTGVAVDEIVEITFPSEWVRIFGPDAKDFLHRLTTADFRNLLVGEATPGFFLTAPGKVRAGFYAYCVTAGEYLFRVPATGPAASAPAHAWTDALLSVIDQFTFAEKLTVERVTPVFVRDFLGETTVPEGALRIAVPGSLRIDWGSRAYGRPWITAVSITPGAAVPPPSTHPRLDGAALERLRVEALSPNWTTEIQPDANPLELGLTTFIAENKGCYPGQEVIEKIISLGSPAKRLALLKRTGSSAAAARVGDSVRLDGAPVGTLTTVADDLALALLRRNALTAKNLESAPISPGTDASGDDARAEWELVRF